MLEIELPPIAPKFLDGKTVWVKRLTGKNKISATRIYFTNPNNGAVEAKAVVVDKWIKKIVCVELADNSWTMYVE